MVVLLNETSRVKPAFQKMESYLERGLPPFLMESITSMKAAWKKLDSGKPYLRWDCDYCNLQTDINNAEVNQIINSER